MNYAKGMGSNHARNALDIRHLSEKMADTAKGVRQGTKRKQKGFYVANKKKVNMDKWLGIIYLIVQFY